MAQFQITIDQSTANESLQKIDSEALDLFELICKDNNCIYSREEHGTTISIRFWQNPTKVQKDAEEMFDLEFRGIKKVLANTILFVFGVKKEQIRDRVITLLKEKDMTRFEKCIKSVCSDFRQFPSYTFQIGNQPMFAEPLEAASNKSKHKI